MYIYTFIYIYIYCPGCCTYEVLRSEALIEFSHLVRRSCPFPSTLSLCSLTISLNLTFPLFFSLLLSCFFNSRDFICRARVQVGLQKRTRLSQKCENINWIVTPTVSFLHVYSSWLFHSKKHSELIDQRSLVYHKDDTSDSLFIRLVGISLCIINWCAVTDGKET